MSIFQGVQSGATTGRSFVLQLYLYTFVVFFITCVQNMFIMIIQTGFASAHAAVYPETQPLLIENVIIFCLALIYFSFHPLP